MLSKQLRRGGLSAALATVLAFSAVGAISAGPVEAAVGPCRSDPIVVLSNLKTMDISAVINDDQSDLHSVTYTMHLPVGVRPVLVIPTDGLVGQVEHFAAYSDLPAGQYTVTTYVSTGKTVPITATVLGILARLAVADGQSNEDVTVRL